MNGMHVVKLGVAVGCALVLAGCLGMQPPAPQHRVIKYAYCTDMQGNVVKDPARAVAQGKALRCYNFMPDSE